VNYGRKMFMNAAESLPSEGPLSRRILARRSEA
jgi:hypothetical protein